MLGFFLLSGYLVTGSRLNARSTGAYLLHRILRIYPAFCVASLICLVVVAPLAGAAPDGAGEARWLGIGVNLLNLQMPGASPAFAHQHYHLFDGAMWTLSSEMVCYILLTIASSCGLLRQRWLFLALTAALISFGVFIILAGIPINTRRISWLPLVAINADFFIWWSGMFAVGACYRLFAAEIPMDWRLAAVAGTGLFLGLHVGSLAFPAIAICGSYLLFWLATRPMPGFKGGIDISYGVYLFAWPITCLLILYHPQIPLLVLTCLSLSLSGIAGTLSWFLVEQPMMRLRYWHRDGAIAVPEQTVAG